MVLNYQLFIDQKKHLSEHKDPDYYEFTRGKKIPPEGLPGFDFSDPESIVEFTKWELKLCSYNKHEATPIATPIATP